MFQVEKLFTQMLSSAVVAVLSLASLVAARVEPPLDNAARLTVGDFEDITCFNFTEYASPLCNFNNADGDSCLGNDGMNPLMPVGCFFDIDPTDPVFDNFEYRASGIGAGSRVGIVAGDSDVDPDLAFAEGEIDGEDFPEGRGELSAYIVGTGTLMRKVDGVIDSRINYEFSVDFCTGNTSTSGTVSLGVFVSNETAPFDVGTDNGRPPIGESYGLGEGLRVTQTVEDGAGNATCGTLTVRFRHYEMFAHIGVNGFTIELSADLASTVFFDNAVLDDTDELPTVYEDCKRVFINEIDYFTATEDSDTATTQTNAIELAGPVGEFITNYQIFLIDGETGIAYLSAVQTSVESFPGDNDLDQIGVITFTFADGLMNAENNEADAILIVDADGDPVQFLCYGLDEDTPPLTITQAGSVTFTGAGIECEQVVSRNGTVLFENDGMFQNDDDPLFTVMLGAPTAAPTPPTPVVGAVNSLQLRGCGECYQDFDWHYAAPSTHGAEAPNAPPPAGFGMAFAGMQNTEQVFCSDADLDGYWPADSTLQPDGAGQFFTPGPTTGCCSGNDCQPRYGHINPGADEICDGFDSNCDGNINNDEGDFDGDGRIACAGDCDDSDDTTFGPPTIQQTVIGTAIPLMDFENAVVIDNVFYRNINEAYNITVATQCAFDFPNQIEGTECSAGEQLTFAPVAELAAEELCDEADNDCNGIDNDPFLPYVTHYKDSDGDYFGDPDSDNNDDLKLLPNCFASPDGSAENRTFPEGFAPNNLDCDDTRADVHPFIETDTCDGVDNDCDELIDEDADDADGDGFPEVNCTTASPGTLAAQFTDCNDTNNQIFPGATEICDGFDNDCDPSEANRLDEDEDNDNFIECEPLPGTLGNFPSTLNTSETDCNDTNANTFPGAPDLCRDIIDVFSNTGAGDGQDNDCNLIIDDGEPDADNDDFPVLQCNTSDSEVASNPSDCDDTEPTRFPGNEEICDGLDNDCDLVVPDDELDLDGDRVVNCTLEVGVEDYVSSGPSSILGGDDCDDNDATVRPNVDGLPTITDDFATCDGIDQDCDAELPGGGIDEDGDPDADDDGFPFRGDCVDSTLAIASQPEDCDDTRAETNPGVEEDDELCDGRDNNCDGVIPSDEIDSDGDLFVECLNPNVADFNGTISGGNDCGEGDVNINPGVVDGCENGCGVNGDTAKVGQQIEETSECAFVNSGSTRFGVDNDCDGTIDEDNLIDADGDGVFDQLCLSSNAAGANGVDGVADCDDNDDARFPGNPEICDGIDNDCDDDLPTDEKDIDGDGALACKDDCDDNNPNRFKGNPEICDGIDNDCDEDQLIDCIDTDGDGFPNQECSTSPNALCRKPFDCDDTKASINPGADEGCDGIDTNCDGSLGENEQDLDGDGVSFCDGDCGPEDATIFPGAQDTCDGKNNDCDEFTDEDAVDADGDGAPFQSCQTATSGTLAAQPQDCDDNDPDNSPLFSEIEFPGDTGFGDGRDNDCDQIADNGLPRLQGSINVECVDDSESSSSESSGECDNANIVIKLINTGLGDAEEVAVRGRIQLPHGANFASLTVGSGTDIVNINAGGDFLWRQGVVPSGQSESVSIPIDMDGKDTGAVGVQAKIVDAQTENGEDLSPVVVFTI